MSETKRDAKELRERLEKVEARLDDAFDFCNYQIDNEYPQKAIEPLNRLLYEIEAVRLLVHPVLKAIDSQTDEAAA